MKKILLLTTGGTIASSDSGSGLVPSVDANQLIRFIPQAYKMCELHTLSVMNIDSTNMNPQLMMELARAVSDNYNQYDGFVITHGTDTMAYSAAALSYMLQNPGKPIVLTGSQLPVSADGTDAVRNLTDAIMFAADGLCGIYVVFNGKVINGTHAMKVSTRSFDAFESINYPVEALIDSAHIRYTGNTQHKEHKGEFAAKINLCTDVFPLKIYPGIDGRIFDFIKKNYHGVVIESFGIGGIPDEYNNILPKINELTESGIAVAVTTQCLYEGIDLSVYEVGQMLARQNIISCADMTFEAAFIKLMWALAHYDTVSEVKNFMEKAYFNDKSY